MTLNFSRRPIFHTNPSEDNLLSSIRIGNGYGMEGVSEKNGEGWHFNWEFGNSFDNVRDMAAGRGNNTHEQQIGTDIIDLLPVDPFDMNKMSATFTAITDWFEDNFIWNVGLKLPSDPGSNGVFERSNEQVEGKGSGGDGGCPHEGLLFALSYLNVQDLLSAERVCRSLRYAVQSDSLLWRNIHIDKPLNERITDDALLRLANRAQGKLQSLSLVDCCKITDDGLKCVLESNPCLTKLNIPGCQRITVEGIVNNLKDFKPTSTPGMKQLRIGGRYDVTHIHFEELKFLLGADKCVHTSAHKPQFYHGHNSLFYDDDCAIDIEICPRCQQLRLVYDCPAESCQGTLAESQSCRACKNCIARCSQCGRCLKDGRFEETFCLDLLCSDCKQLSECQEEQEE